MPRFSEPRLDFRRGRKMVESGADMMMNNPASPYALGSTDAEHERLIRQAARLAPLTERLFREAGIGAGQRVLDLGSGVGDVAMLAARLVGHSGEVVGIERDQRSLDRARARVAEAGLHNVSFIQSDVSQITASKPFDSLRHAARETSSRGCGIEDGCHLDGARRGMLSHGDNPSL